MYIVQFLLNVHKRVIIIFYLYRSLSQVLGMAFVPLGDHGLYVSQLRLYLNMYTGPGYLGAMLIVLNLILVLALFRDSRLPMQAPMKRGSSILGRIG